MGVTEEDLEHMEAYLDGNLSTDERSDFENRLLEEPDFAAAFDSFLYSYHAILRHSRKELKTRLQSLETPARQRTRDWKYVGLAIAASITLIIMMVTYFNDATPQELYAEYYTPYPNVVAPIERAQPETDTYKRSFQLYEEKRYSEALGEFKSLLNDQPDSPALNFYAGLSTLSLNDVPAAMDYLKKVASSKNDFTAHAVWYSALAYLLSGQKEKAIVQLEKISHDSFYNEKADHLLKEIQ
jgi:predicted Zn-dependent protease